MAELWLKWQVDIYSKAMEVMEDYIEIGEKVDLFSKLQQIVAILQLHFIMDYTLPAGWILVLMSNALCSDLQ